MANNAEGNKEKFVVNVLKMKTDFQNKALCQFDAGVFLFCVNII